MTQRKTSRRNVHKTAARETSCDAGRLWMSEFIGFDADGRLRIESIDAATLAEKFGTPLYVTSEQQIRHNFRRLHRAFTHNYPYTTLLYANKANSNLAVRHILTEEGAGGDCFGLGELTISLQSGVPPVKLVLNGSNKTAEELRAAIEIGATINVDHPDELKTIGQLAQVLDATAIINLRVLPFSYADLASLTPELAEIAADRSHDKWGMDPQTVRSTLGRALEMNRIRVRGLHMHVGRVRPTTQHLELGCALLLECILELRKQFAWTPQMIDIGGGFAHERDPEGGRPAGDHEVSTPERYAEVVTTLLRSGMAKNGLEEPELAIEPGRRLVSNATVLLTRVGVIKQLPSRTETWINVDASTSHCLRASLEGYYYEIVHTARGREPRTCMAHVIGPTCTTDLLGEARALPLVNTGDVLAILDVGGYAEVLGTQLNLLPRPASVLVNANRVDLIRRRETLQDILATQIVPLRFLH